MSVDKSDLSTLLSSSTLMIAGMAITSASTLVERIVVARLFSLDLYGQVTIGLAIMSITTGIAMAGLNDGVPRFISRYEDEMDIRGVWITGIGLSVVIATAFAAFLYLNIELVVQYLFDDADAIGLVRLFVLAIPISVGFRVGLSALRGMENTRYKIYAGDLVYPVLRISLIVAFVTLGGSILSVGYAYVAAAVVALLATHLLLSRLVSLVGPFELHVRALLTFSAPLVVSTILATLLTRTDMIMLGFFKSSSEAGLYSATYSLATGLLIVVSSFGYLYLPLTSRLDADGERGAITDVYRITTKWGFVVSFPAFVVFLAFPGDVLAIVFREEFRAGAIGLVILAVGFFSNAALGRNRETLAALGSTKQIMASNVIALALNVVLNLVLIPPYGLAGAAVASTVSYVGRNVVINLVLAVEYDITPLSTHTVRTYVLLPVVLLPPTLAVAQYVTVSMVLLPVILAVLGLATLLIVAASGSVQPADLVVVEFVEDVLGVRIPYVRRFV